MPVYLHHIETLVPEHVYSQAFALERTEAWLADDTQRRLARRVYKHSGIDTRYSVLGDFKPDATEPLFKTGPDGKPMAPGTRARNERFARDARRLAVAVARQALARYPG
ncbi:MAG: type III polyketide synthase, partial [Lentisphaerae bacterium]|nr:type III polyketide synthase [Lentisphaerota bacterium]